MRIITLEEHFASPGFLDGPGKDLKERALRFSARAAHLLEQLTDLGDKRIAEMDAAGIDMQVLSLTSPGAEQLEDAQAIALAREANDVLADAVAQPALLDLRSYQPQPRNVPPKSWSTWSGITASKARSSMGTTADAISMTSLSGPFLNELSC
jgi:hypothetical protein